MHQNDHASGLKGATSIGQNSPQTQFSILGIALFTNKNRFKEQQIIWIFFAKKIRFEMNTKSNLIPLCLNFTVYAQEMYKSFAQWGRLWYFSWEITVEITICHWKKVHCHYSRKDLPVHVESPQCPNTMDRRGPLQTEHAIFWLL